MSYKKITDTSATTSKVCAVAMQRNVVIARSEATWQSRNHIRKSFL